MPKTVDAEVMTPAVAAPGAALKVPQGLDPAMANLMQIALEKGTVESLERLVELSHRVEDRRAAQEFAEAMAAFKASCPPIPRRTENSQFTVTRNGTKVPRRYASLEDIEATVRGPLGEHGLSFRWSDTKVESGAMTMTCVVTHVGGHAEIASVVLPVDSKAGCSDQQKYGSAMTYAQRYSLIQALGLTTCDEDDDGRGPGKGPPPAPGTPVLSENQVANIEALIEETGAERAGFLKWLGVESVEAIPAGRYSVAVKALESKRGKAK